MAVKKVDALPLISILTGGIVAGNTYGSGTGAVKNDREGDSPGLDTRGEARALAALDDDSLMELLYREYREFLYAIARAKIWSARLPIEDADDCFADIILRVCENGCRKLRQFRGGSTFRTYLAVLARNLATDFIRRERRKRDRLLAFDEFTVPEAVDEAMGAPAGRERTPEEQLLAAQRMEDIREALDGLRSALDRLCAEDRLIVTLRVENGMSYREIDEYLGIENARYRLTKIYQELRLTFDAGTRMRLEELLREEGI